MKNGRATLLGTDTLAGSSSNLLQELQNVVSFGLPLEDAITALTFAPAKAVPAGPRDRFHRCGQEG